MSCTSNLLLSPNGCVFASSKPVGRFLSFKSGGRKLLVSVVRASSDDPDCNAEECAPDKEVGTVSMEWLAGEKTKVVGTFPPRKQRSFTGYVEKDTAGQTNVYSVEPPVYVAESAISSGTAGSSSDGAENTAAIVAGLALISIAAASSILLQVGKNAPSQPQTVDYSGPSLSYYINKFKPSEMVQPSAPTLTEAPHIHIIHNQTTKKKKKIKMELVEESEGIKKMGERIVVDKAYLYEEDKPLTVCKTSLFYTGDGFAAYDCNGDIIFRVDSYGPDTRDNDEIVLMNATGKCLLTVKRKRPTLHQRWEGFLGERSEGQKPIFSVRRSSIIGRCTMEVEVYDGTGEEYTIDGDFSQRSCVIYDTEKRTVAEIKRKVDASTNVMLGRDVFNLHIKPGFDGAFAMGLVLVLDQINGDDPVEIGDEQVHPFVED